MDLAAPRYRGERLPNNMIRVFDYCAKLSGLYTIRNARPIMRAGDLRDTPEARRAALEAHYRPYMHIARAITR